MGLYLEGLSYEELMRRTRHSLGSVKQYIMTFGRVACAIRKGIKSAEEVGYLVGISGKLAGEYMELYEGYKEKAGVREEIEHLIRYSDVAMFEDEDPRKRGEVE